MNTDPISDMLTRIRNAYAVGKTSVSVGASKIKEAILAILKEAGYIESYKKEGANFEVELKYTDGKPAISKIDRVSKPGRRMYVKKDEIPVVLSGHGTAIMSTPKGVVTGEDAKRQGLGGELIAKVY
jgi:small subunit ribosomal protein S8